MKNSLTKAVDNLINKTLKMNINSTSSCAAFQPKVSKELSIFKKSDNK